MIELKKHIYFILSLWILKVDYCMTGGVPARPLPRPQDAWQATQRQQKDQHDQVSFFKFGAIIYFAQICEFKTREKKFHAVCT
jgi:hypothetical protein